MECNFSLNHYFKTLYDYINAGYIVLPESKTRRHIHLRHDVDLSLSYALELAREEHKRDISATYYIMLHSDLYNATSPEGIDQIQSIQKLGHKIGLHIDTRCHLPNDFHTLSFIVGERVGDWRKHLSNLTQEFIVPEPQPKNYKYLSDSGMNWREGCFCQHIGKWDKIEILIHPEWWIAKGSTQMDKICNLELDTKCELGKSFGGFRQMVQEYIQAIKQ